MVYPPAMVWAVSRLYASGFTQDEVADRIGVSQKVVWNVMRRHNIPRRAAAKRDQFGEKNHQWKGEEAGYQAMHLRVEKRYGKPMKCASCGTDDPTKSYDWANVTGNYHDPDDYRRMCRSCHRKFDLARRRETAQ